jgi:tetratricopeptide (TPR) repeat protein
VAVEFLTHREGRRAGRMAGELALAVIVSYGILWAFYGFHYAARPDGLFMVPPLPVFAMQLPSGAERWVVLHLARWHLLPEAYLYGWTKLPIDQIGHPAFLFGHVYPRGVWYYFPAAVLVKTSLTMLLLVFSVPLLFVRQLRRFQRELSFLVLPVVVILGAAMTSHLDIGVRHVLTLYPFFAVLGGAAAWALAEASRVGRYAVAALLLFQVISSLHAFPNYLPYGNEAFGGSGRTYRALADSNVDWGQQMQQVREYLQGHPARECWFATPQFFPSPVIPGTPCKALPSGFSFWAGLPMVTIPEHIDGVVLVGATDAAGALWGGDGMNPYQQFEDGRPEAKIANAVLVYRGSFDIPLAAAQAHYSHVGWLLREGKAEQALAEAQTAASLVPWSAQVQAELGQTLLRLHREGEANEAFAKALQMAKAKSPQDQSQIAELIEGLRHPRF